MKLHFGMVFFQLILLHIFRTPLLKNTSGGVLLQWWRIWSLLTILSNKTFYLKSDEYPGGTYRKIKIIVLAAPKPFRHNFWCLRQKNLKLCNVRKMLSDHFVAQRNICTDSIVLKGFVQELDTKLHREERCIKDSLKYLRCRFLWN